MRKLENEKGLNLARERENKVKNGKKKVLNIVEELLEESKIEEDKLLIFCKFLSKNDYEDAIVERSLIKVCGYPLCDNVLGTPAKQKFKISLAEHKVYDIEKRKMFCSDRCYKASCYLQDQLEDEPFWMKSIDVMTLPDVLLYSDTKGSKGEEIKLIPSVDLEDEPLILLFLLLNRNLVNRNLLYLHLIF